MPQDATLHIKMDPQMARSLKALARSRGQTMGEIVRQAIVACYQPSLVGLTEDQSEALCAYRGGFISLGRLAEAMGLHVLALRRWLREHDIPENSCLGEDDAAHA